MRCVCSKCGSPELERSAWIDMQTEEEVAEVDSFMYFCRSCGALVDITKIEEDEEATIDPELTNGKLDKPSQYEGRSGIGWNDYPYGPD